MGLKDDMWRLEAKGHESDVKKPTGSNIMFVRGDEQSKAVQEMQSTENPDEIDISEDEDEDEEVEGGEDGEPPKKKEKVAVEEMDVPDKVFGGLKKPSAEKMESRPRRKRRWRWRRWMCRTRCLE